MEERQDSSRASVPLGLVAPMPMLFSKKHPLSRPLENLGLAQVLSAKTSSALDAATANLVEHLKQHPDINLDDVTPIKWVEGLSTIDGYWCARPLTMLILETSLNE